MDIVGKMEKRWSGYQYILVISNYERRFLEAWRCVLKSRASLDWKQAPIILRFTEQFNKTEEYAPWVSGRYWEFLVVCIFDIHSISPFELLYGKTIHDLFCGWQGLPAKVTMFYTWEQVEKCNFKAQAEGSKNGCMMSIKEICMILRIHPRLKSFSSAAKIWQNGKVLWRGPTSSLCELWEITPR